MLKQLELRCLRLITTQEGEGAYIGGTAVVSGQDVIFSRSIELLARGGHVLPQIRQPVCRHGQVISEGAQQKQGQAA